MTYPYPSATPQRGPKQQPGGQELEADAEEDAGAQTMSTTRRRNSEAGGKSDDDATTVRSYLSMPMGATDFLYETVYRPPRKITDNYAGYGYKMDFDIDLEMVDQTVIKAFQLIDTNNSGRLSRSEMLAAFCNPNGSDFTRETVTLLCGMFDSDSSGGLDLRDFAHLYYFMEEWLLLWRQYDGSGKGYMKNTEMVHALRDLGYTRIDAAIVTQLCSKLSKAGKRLYMDPFVRICSVCKRITDNFRKKDKKRSGKLRMSYHGFIKIALRSCF